jgi:hypothetical protein
VTLLVLCFVSNIGQLRTALLAGEQHSMAQERRVMSLINLLDRTPLSTVDLNQVQSHSMSKPE